MYFKSSIAKVFDYFFLKTETNKPLLSSVLLIRIVVLKNELNF